MGIQINLLSRTIGNGKSCMVCRLYFNLLLVSKRQEEASRGAGAQSVTVSRLVVSSIPTRGDEIFT